MKKEENNQNDSENQKTDTEGVWNKKNHFSSGDLTKDQLREISRAARYAAKQNGKRITMSMFFVEDL